MPRKGSEPFPEGNVPVLQQEEFGSDRPTLAGVYRMMEELFEKLDRKMEELAEEMKATDRRLASLQ